MLKKFVYLLNNGPHHRSTQMQKVWHPIFNKFLIVIVSGVYLGSCSWAALKTYEPTSPAIEQLAIDTTMTPIAQQLFYKQDPQIKPKKQFHKLCSKVERNSDQTILLGCFTSNGYQGNIILQSVTDPRLQGMMEMVAAHEMLHAAYQDFSPQERSFLSPKLKKAAQRVTEKDLLAVLKAYEVGDTDIYVNELHSHLGTRLSDLGDPKLEQHYRKYFRNRQQVVQFAKRSRRFLAEIETQIQQLEPEINALEANLKIEKDVIQQTDNNLKASAQNLDQMKLNLSNLKQQAETFLRKGDASLVNQFEQERARFNAEVNQYNWQVQDLQERLAQFNIQVETYAQKVEEYNALANSNRSILSTIKVDSPKVNIQPVSP